MSIFISTSLSNKQKSDYQWRCRLTIMIKMEWKCVRLHKIIVLFRIQFKNMVVSIDRARFGLFTNKTNSVEYDRADSALSSLLQWRKNKRMPKQTATLNINACYVWSKRVCALDGARARNSPRSFWHTWNAPMFNMIRPICVLFERRTFVAVDI